METQRTVNKYILLRKIGQGGMAEVWEARHLKLNKLFAIKFLLPQLANDPELKTRFRNEGQRQAVLEHPNIVGVTDFFEEDGHDYLVMQLIDGINLETRLAEQKGPLPLDEIHAISWDVLSALDHAHSRELIHRDIKPSNILIDSKGSAHLMDFGIALDMNQRNRLTKISNLPPGTPAYMSPEQIQGETLTSRSDLYSFGCVLYAMLTGGPPFPDQGVSEYQLKEWHVRNTPPPVTQKNPSVPAAVQSVVMQCMAKIPDQRFPNGHALKKALDAAFAVTQPPVPHFVTPPPVASPVPPPSTYPLPYQSTPGMASANRQQTILEPNLHPSFPPQPKPYPQPQPYQPQPYQPQPYQPMGHPPQPGQQPYQPQPQYQPPQPFRPPQQQPQSYHPPVAMHSTETKSGSRQWLLIAAGLIVLAGLGFGGYKVWGPKDPDVVTPVDGAAPVALRMEGSTTIGDELAPALIKAYLEKQGVKPKEIATKKSSCGDDCTKIMITAEVPGGVRQSYVVTANGSGKAFKAIGARNADIGMSSRLAAEDEVEQLKGLGDMRSRSCEHIIALDGIAIVVNEGNQVKQLDRSQVSEIFQGKITDWSAVGGRPGPIQLYARNKDSGTGKDFAGMVLGKGAAISAAARVKASGDEIAAAVSSDPGGIGYVAIAQVNGVKALAISDGTGSTALAPSPFTVLTEDYVLSRRLYLYAPGSPADFANKLITFANTAEGQEVVKKTGFVQQTPELMPSPDIPASAPVEYREHIAGKQRININFRFESNGKALDNKAEADIDRVVKFLQARNVRQGVYLPGFADSEGGHSAQNCALSLERAQAVKDILFSSGINATVGGLCDDLPVGDNATDAGRRKNRRVEVWIP